MYLCGTHYKDIGKDLCCQHKIYKKTLAFFGVIDYTVHTNGWSDTENCAFWRKFPVAWQVDETYTKRAFRGPLLISKKYER